MTSTTNIAAAAVAAADAAYRIPLGSLPVPLLRAFACMVDAAQDDDDAALLARVGEVMQQWYRLGVSGSMPADMLRPMQALQRAFEAEHALLAALAADLEDAA